MRVEVGMMGEKKRKIDTDATDIAGLLHQLNTNPETVIVRQNSEIRTFDSKLSEGDEIQIIPVVSGG